MFTLTSRSPSCSSAIRSRTGATAWHGPHHSAQKSTRTGSALSRTSCSNVDSVMVSAIPGETYTDRSMFRPLPPVPDHPALEEEVLAWWEERRTFERLREQNRGGPRFSFFD